MPFMTMDVLASQSGTRSTLKAGIRHVLADVLAPDRGTRSTLKAGIRHLLANKHWQVYTCSSTDVALVLVTTNRVSKELTDLVIATNLGYFIDYYALVAAWYVDP
jgi:hypothetical protein